MNKKIVLLGIIGFLVISLIAGGLFFYFKMQASKNLEDPTEEVTQSTEQTPADKNIKKIPKQYEIILKEIEKLANQRLENCYLVGGIVRDLLLGIENLDLDIVVEGDALSFGAELAKNLDIPMGN